jgi:hypothetical protein
LRSLYLAFRADEDDIETRYMLSLPIGSHLIAPGPARAASRATSSLD